MLLICALPLVASLSFFATRFLFDTLDREATERMRYRTLIAKLECAPRCFEGHVGREFRILKPRDL